MRQLRRFRFVRAALAAGVVCSLTWACASLAWAVDEGRPASSAASSGSAESDAQLVARISQRLAQTPGIRTHFRQTQTLAVLAAPLVSTGTLVFMRDRGVIWRVEAPHPVTYAIGDAGVTRIDASGRRSAQGAPRGGLARVSQMMRAMLGGDLSALYSQFDVVADGTPARWRLLLTPNQPQLAQFVKTLRMEGGALVQTIVITAANGDTTRIEFSAGERIDALSPAELALFGAH